MYKTVMRSWTHTIFSHPGSLIKVSLIFLLCSFPIITVGWAFGIAIQIAHGESEGYKLKCLQTIGKNFSRGGLVLFFMGLMDMVFVVMAFLSFISLLQAGNLLTAKILYSVFIWIDIVILISGIYRYPLAAFNPDFDLKKIISTGILLALFRPGQTLLVTMVIVFVLMVTSISGLFLPLLAPGAVALLCTHAFLRRED
jgi:hypothetical protein